MVGAQAPRRSSSNSGQGPVTGPGVAPARNVLGGALACCCADVRGTGVGTGFFRDGHCSTGPQDRGRHTVCCGVTAEFLAFTRSVGNDLSTPRPEFNFPGLNPGDKWCLCASRWEEARLAGVAPGVYLKATHEATLKHTSLEHLKEFALDADEADADVARVDALRRDAMRVAGLEGGPAE